MCYHYTSSSDFSLGCFGQAVLLMRAVQSFYYQELDKAQECPAEAD